MAKEMTAKYGNYTINIEDSGTVKVSNLDSECKNTKAALREIANLVGFTLEEKWNTRQSGKKLVEYLNTNPTTSTSGDFLEITPDTVIDDIYIAFTLKYPHLHLRFLNKAGYMDELVDSSKTVAEIRKERLKESVKVSISGERELSELTVELEDHVGCSAWVCCHYGDDLEPEPHGWERTLAFAESKSLSDAEYMIAGQRKIDKAGNILASESEETTDGDVQSEDDNEDGFTLEQQFAAICLYMANIDGEATQREINTFLMLSQQYPDMMNEEETLLAFTKERLIPSDIDEVVYSVTVPDNQKFLYFCAAYIAFSDNKFAADEQHLLSLMAKIWELDDEYINNIIDSFKNHYKTATIETYWRDNYDEIIEREELAGFVVIKDEKFGFVDENGNELISPRYNRVCDDPGKLYAVLQGSRWGFVNHSCEEIVSPKYTNYRTLDCGLIAVKTTKWGVIDTDGNLIIDNDYLRIGELEAEGENGKSYLLLAHLPGAICNYDTQGNMLGKLEHGNYNDTEVE